MNPTGVDVPDGVVTVTWTRPAGSPGVENEISVADTTVTSPAGTVSALADYIGAGDVVGRYDVEGTGSIGARVEEQLEAELVL